MKITLICNCGLALESGGQTLLLDALTQELPPFYRTPEKTRREIIAGEGEYASVCGLLFTHLHPTTLTGKRPKNFPRGTKTHWFTFRAAGSLRLRRFPSAISPSSFTACGTRRLQDTENPPLT